MTAKAPAARPRMADVARRAGVATITVSRALATPERVSADVRERVRAAVEASGYVPNLAAGTLKSQRSRMVAAIVPTLRNSIFAGTVEGLAEGLRVQGYQLLLASSGYSMQAEEEILQNLLGQQPVAVVLTGTRHTPAVRAMLRGRRIPVVETWDLSDEPIDRVVGFSNLEASRQLTHALAARGYRRITFAGTPPDVERRSGQRQAGYLRAVEELGLVPDVIELGDLAVSIDAGARAVDQLLARPRPPEALFMVNDLVAFGAVQACQRRGVPVPAALAIAGFGDFEVARSSHPPLTTVRVPGDAIGRVTAERVVAALSGNDTAPRVLDLGFEVVMRGSA